jgi:hypothetical protein
MYLFLASFIFMQLIEFFIWRNLHNAYNHLFSVLALLLVSVQPLISLSMLPATLRTILMVAYVALVGGYMAPRLNSNIHSEVSKSGHLQWWFLKTPNEVSMVWLFFFLFSFVYHKMWWVVALAALTIGVSRYTYAKDKTISSMWCWMANGYMLLLALYLLVWLPYQEHGFCA